MPDKPLDQMTSEEKRDELAHLDGWWRHPDTDDWLHDTKPSPWGGRHPIPDTLDGAADAMPEEYVVTIGQYCHAPFHWFAHARPRGVELVMACDDDGEPLYPCVNSMATEKEARFTLALACRRAMSKEKNDG